MKLSNRSSALPIGIDMRTRYVGLGVYIVDTIVKAHGGTVPVISTAETGTTFIVRRPGDLGPNGSRRAVLVPLVCGTGPSSEASLCCRGIG